MDLAFSELSPEQLKVVKKLYAKEKKDNTIPREVKSLSEFYQDYIDCIGHFPGLT